MWRKMLLGSFVPLLALIPSAHGDLDSGQTLNGVKETEFAQLSQRDLNPLGEKALAIHPEQWKHAEGEHFIYHFVHSFVATPVSVEAEFYYRVIAKTLEREQPAGDTKSHIYIFESSEDWQQFQQLGSLEKWTGGIHSGGSLFIVRDPHFKFANNTLGHEISHLIVHRFYSEGVPCWIDEGFAEYVSRSAHASYQRARGYIAKPRSQSLGADELIAVSTLVGSLRPPPDQVAIFYGESERLVRFLVATDKATFLTLLDALGHHQPFEKAFLCLYTGRFANAAVFEERFRDYAAKDAAPDADSG